MPAPEAGPVRLRLSRARGFDLQAHSRATNGLPARAAVRPGPLGNEFRVTPERSAEMAVALFDHALDKNEAFHPDEYKALMEHIRGHNLGCYCAIGAPCHVDIWLRRSAEWCADHPELIKADAHRAAQDGGAGGEHGPA